MVIENAFTLISDGRTVKLEYTDSNSIFPVTIRDISIGDYVVVQGDNNSEIITFEFDRYVEGIDLSTKMAEVIFVRPDNYAGSVECINFRYSEDKIRFSWVLNSTVTCCSGVLRFVVNFNAENYSLKTSIGTLTVVESLSINSGEGLPSFEDDPYLVPNEVTILFLEAKLSI